MGALTYKELQTDVSIQLEGFKTHLAAFKPLPSKKD